MKNEVKKFTDAQLSAIEHRGGNLVLSAAAGSGKTATLTEKIIRLISDSENGIDISRMLIVTFTKAAAGELRGRISDALSREMEKNPSSRLLRQMSKLDSAQISTIHSFLLSELKTHFSDFGLSPDFGLIDDAEAEILKNAAIGETVSYFLSLPDSDGRKALFDKFGITVSSAKNEESAGAALREYIDKYLSLGKDVKDLRECAAKLIGCKNIMDTVYGDAVKKEVTDFACHFREKFMSVSKKLCLTEKLSELKAECDGFSDYLLKLSSADGYGEYKRLTDSFEIPRIPNVIRRSNNNEEEFGAYDEYKTVRNNFKELLKNILVFFYEEEDTVLRSAVATGEMISSFADVTEYYTALYTEKKRERGRVDYQDLERCALKLYVSENGEPTEAARETGQKFDIIFVDEYQDTNTVQDKIFSAIGAGCERFMVGDVKQSIYGFRGASPEVFTSYRERYEKKDGGDAVFLSENFRSSESVIDFVNLVSSYMFSFGKTPFDDNDKLICKKEGGKDNPVPVEVCYLNRPDQRASKKAELDGSVKVSEAEYVAERVAAILSETEETDGEARRKYKPGDIAVLMKSRSGAEEYFHEFEKRNIPYNDSIFGSVFGKGEMLLMICYLKCAENPLRDIYLAGAMKSPLSGFSLDDIVNLRREKDIPLWYSLVSYTETGEKKELREKCLQFVKMLEKWREMSGSSDAEEMTRQILTDTGMATFGGDGVRSRKDIRRSVKRIMGISADVARAGGGLHELTERIDAVMSNSGDGDYIPDEGKVAFLTVHKSKGLEFPVCIVPKCSSLFNKEDEKPALLFDKRGVIGIKLLSNGLVRCDNMLRTAVKRSIKKSSAEEGTRLLYVAMTRAKERLILISTTPNTEKKKSELEESGSRDGYIISLANSFENWITGALKYAGAHPSYKTVFVNECTFTALPENENGETENKEATAYDDCFSKETPEYTGEFLGKIPAKLTVSVLSPEVLNRAGENEKRYFDTPEIIKIPDSPPVPAFLSGDKKTGADKGTATHIFMQFCDFSNLYENGAEAELERLISQRFISKENASLVRLPEIELFRKSEIFGRILSAKDVMREKRFNVSLPAEKFTTDEALREKLIRENVKITVQGVVDCIFTENDGKTVLLDYKTDRLTKEETENSALAEKKLLDRHTPQLVMYRDVCSNILGREFDEVYIYSLPLGRTVEVKNTNA